MKVCCRCRDGLDESAFNKNQQACRACQSAYYYARPKEHQKRVRANNDRYVARNKAIVLEHLQRNACVDCGEADTVVLEFDHVRGVKRDDISRLLRQGGSVAALLDEMAKCEVRCANCHRRVTAARRAPGEARTLDIPD